MELILLFLLYVILIYLIFKLVFLLQLKKKNMKKDLYKISELEILRNRFKIDTKSFELQRLLNIVSLSDAIIFAIVLVGTSFIDNYLLRLLAMFVLLIPVIYFVYLGVSKWLKREENKKNV